MEPKYVVNKLILKYQRQSLGNNTHTTFTRCAGDPVVYQPAGEARPGAGAGHHRVPLGPDQQGRGRTPASPQEGVV